MSVTRKQLLEQQLLNDISGKTYLASLKIIFDKYKVSCEITKKLNFNELTSKKLVDILINIKNNSGLENLKLVIEKAIIVKQFYETLTNMQSADRGEALAHCSRLIKQKMHVVSESDDYFMINPEVL